MLIYINCQYCKYKFRFSLVSADKSNYKIKAIVHTEEYLQENNV